jgi:HK97 family phage portal protein
VRIFGLDIARRTKAVVPAIDAGALLSADGQYGGGWFPIVREVFSGAWQRNVVVDRQMAMSFHAVWACATRISSDISKLRIKLIGLDSDGIWQETTNPAYSALLRDPNDYQNDHQFWEYWILSKLLHGNTFVLKERHGGGGVGALHVLDPNRVLPKIADDGSVFYELAPDSLRGIAERIIVPAREIIHDRWNCLFHPLIGHTPIFACGLAATQGLRIQESSEAFFRNAANPSGLLVAPGRIEEATARRIEESFSENYSGTNSGRIAVVGDNLKFQPMTMTATDAQLIEQLKLSAEQVCGCFHVPPYKVGIGNLPTGSSIEATNIEYYSDALQKLIEDAEGCLDRGLQLGSTVGVEFDLDGLLRMDTPAKVAALKDGVLSAIYAPNEARRKFDLPPVEGGESPYLQQQNYSLAALAKRDASADPFLTARVSETVRPTSVTEPIDVPALEDDTTPPDSTPKPKPAAAPTPSGKQAIINTLAADQLNAALVEIYRGLA